MRRGDDGPGIRVRLVRPADAAAIAAIYAPIVRDTAASFETEPPDTDEVERRIRGIVEQLPWLVAARSSEPGEEEVLGYALATPYRSRAAYRWSVEVSVYIDEPARGRGVATSLYHRLHDVLRRQGYQVTYAVITIPNSASVGLHEGLGYERIGTFHCAGYKLGAWHDVLWMRREIAPIAGEPVDPVPLGELDRATIGALLD